MPVSRERLHIHGVVQGVGFRPFVFRLARQCRLSGFVNNNGCGVLVEIEGPRRAIDTFYYKLKKEAPPFAKIVAIEREKISPAAECGFRINASKPGEAINTLVSADLAVCYECLEEMFDPANRRYHYPFINCTNCGPRYTIIHTIPYDRPFTSMKRFTMCADCQAEYDNPADRRYHAQPNACHNCGPQLRLSTNDGINLEVNDPLNKAVRLIREGYILAVKGLGGFHLAVDPLRARAVAELRNRKGRHNKPFALMAAGTEIIKKYCLVSEQEQGFLSQVSRPIVILKRSGDRQFPKLVSPGNNYLAFMLPYSPLHFLLMQHFEILIMTSANFTDEPIAITNEEAFDRLKNIADYFLHHDRDILQRCDDSVVYVQAGVQRMIRRSRGYVPEPVYIARKTKKNILATGADLKNTIALSRGHEVFASQHIGDLDNPAAIAFFEDSIQHLQDILRIEAQVIACDMHPDYFSSKWARQQNLPLIDVQHHHAHLAAVMSERQLDEPVIGVIMDGTGYGPDGTIWGSEFLVGDAGHIERFAWFEPVAMPGSDAAVKEPWRMAFSYLKKAFGPALYDLDLSLLKEISGHDRLILEQMIEKDINTPLTSGCGRLFDAVSSILGICHRITFEAQAAAELEMTADETQGASYRQALDAFKSFRGCLNLDPLIKCIVDERLRRVSVAEISAKFHNTLADLIVHVVKEIHLQTQLKRVVLGGGVFQNRFLFNAVNSKLEKEQLRPVTAKLLPVNDGGLALGQIAVADKMLAG